MQALAVPQVISVSCIIRERFVSHVILIFFGKVTVFSCEVFMLTSSVSRVVYPGRLVISGHSQYMTNISVATHTSAWGCGFFPFCGSGNEDIWSWSFAYWLLNVGCLQTCVPFEVGHLKHEGLLVLVHHGSAMQYDSVYNTRKKLGRRSKGDR